jgi:hypothetical protein
MANTPIFVARKNCRDIKNKKRKIEKEPCEYLEIEGDKAIFAALGTGDPAGTERYYLARFILNKTLYVTFPVLLTLTAGAFIP